ncbi:MAG: hypothetical protein P4N59_09560 [Negativicutes bacterium]|nr:hypothetical protein [Negativicutes bacterium]
MNQQSTGTGGFEWLNYNSSNVLIFSTPVMTLDRLSNMTLPGANTILGGTSITVPTSTTASNCVQFLQLNAGNGAYTAEFSVAVSSVSFSESAIYTVPIQFGATGGTWKILTPDKNTASFGSFRIDVLSLDNTTNFRFVRKSGTIAGTAYISAKITGPSDVVYVWQSLVGTDTTVPAVYNASMLSLTGGITLPTTGGTASALNYYEEYTHTIPYSGTTILPSVVHTIVRIGKQVTMTVSTGYVATATLSGYFSTFTALPARFCPLDAQIVAVIRVTNANAYAFGTIAVNSSGFFTVSNGPDDGGLFTNSGLAGIQPFSVSWCVA